MSFKITLQALSREGFAEFGDVIETSGISASPINHGLTLKYGGMAGLHMGSPDNGIVSIYRSQPIELPFRLSELERHNRASQLFMPLHKQPFPIVVAAGGESPGTADIRGFLSNGEQGVCLAPGTWHHHQLSLGGGGDYLVVEGRNNEEFTDTISLEEETWIQT